MPDEKYESLKQYAEGRPRDKNGHFIPQPKPEVQPSQKPNPITQFLHDETAVHKSNDDELVDIHIGNPLKKIQTLLEDIKRQKAFSFNIKGSLGVAGIFLVLGTFGLFGGSKALCNKGVQTKIGVIRTLSYQQAPNETFWYKIPFVNSLFSPKNIGRAILIEADQKAIRLKGAGLSSWPVQDPNNSYLVTGEFDSCSNELTIDSPTSLEPFN